MEKKKAKANNGENATATMKKEKPNTEKNDDYEGNNDEGYGA